MIRLLIISLLLAPLLAACGTKGDLECPTGTIPQPNGTCAPPN